VSIDGDHVHVAAKRRRPSGVHPFGGARRGASGTNAVAVHKRSRLLRLWSSCRAQGGVSDGGRGCCGEEEQRRRKSEVYVFCGAVQRPIEVCHSGDGAGDEQDETLQISHCCKLKFGFLFWFVRCCEDDYAWLRADLRRCTLEV